VTGAPNEQQATMGATKSAGKSGAGRPDQSTSCDHHVEQREQWRTIVLTHPSAKPV